jgi:hypothetical protein
MCADAAPCSYRLLLNSCDAIVCVEREREKEQPFVDNCKYACVALEHITAASAALVCSMPASTRAHFFTYSGICAAMFVCVCVCVCMCVHVCV